MDASEQDFFCIAATPDYRQLEIWSLVLLSADIPHRIDRHQHSWRIYVDFDRAGEAEEQLAAYRRENAGWPPEKPSVEKKEAGHSLKQPPTVLLMGMFILFYAVTGPWASHSVWFQKGAVSLTAVMLQGEWWRLFTALTLHADEVHLMGNVLIGGMVVHLLCSEIGAGPGWLLILLSGGLGNYCNLLPRSTEHLSVGFSTAVFGAIGILCGLAVRRWSRAGDFLVPLGAGFALLALIGTSGERTDIGAHLWGLLTGFVLGMAFSLLRPLLQRAGQKTSMLLLPLCILFMVGCWMLALR